MLMSIKHIYETVSGWFTFPLFYSSVVDQAKDGYHFVEVGTWKGKSACYMAVEIINSEKKIKFDCIDTFKGSEDEEYANPNSSSYEPLLSTSDGLYNHFLDNIKPVKHVVNPIRKSSLEVVNEYADESLNCVFLDAAHDYENVYNDIKAWLPKVKKGNILAGHDWNHSPIQQALDDTIGLDNIIKHWASESVWVYKVK